MLSCRVCLTIALSHTKSQRSDNARALAGKFIVVFKPEVTQDQITEYVNQVNSNGASGFESFKGQIRSHTCRRRGHPALRFNPQCKSSVEQPPRKMLIAFRRGLRPHYLRSLSNLSNLSQAVSSPTLVCAPRLITGRYARLILT